MGKSRIAPLPLAAAVVISVAAIGSAIWVAPTGPGSPTPAQPAAAAIAGDQGDGFRRLFDEGVAHLREGRAHEAIVIFIAAQRLNPRLPEVPVNLGFAYLARGKFEAAIDQFERALELKPDQANAYYGLGQALEELGDLEGALGAMRTYKHLEKSDLAFHRKAEAAIWELEDHIRRKKEGASANLPVGGVTVTDQKRVQTFDDLRKKPGESP